MTYAVEIKLPTSRYWFKYAFGIRSREEAETIKRGAKGEINARVRRESTAPQRCPGCKEALLK
jgi:hypothetical protein